jgi:hypothetical protein
VPYSQVQLTGTLFHASQGEIMVGGGNDGLESATIAFDTDFSSHERLPDGTVNINIHPNTNGRLTLNVNQGEAKDLWLQSLYNLLSVNLGGAQIAAAAGMVGVFTDSAVGRLYTLKGMSIQKAPEVTYPENLPRRPWVLLAAEITIV